MRLVCKWGKDIEYRKYNYIEIPKEEPKQKTIEEAAEYHWKMTYMMALDESTKPYIINDFIAGAKWQEKRMHNDEEVIKIIYQLHLEIQTDEDFTFMKVDKWFEQFKKK